MTILYGSSGGTIGGGNVSSMFLEPNVSQANLNALDRLGQQWGSGLESVWTNISGGGSSVVNFGMHHFDDAMETSSAASDIEAQLGAGAANPTEWNDLMTALATLGRLVTNSVVEDGTVFVTARHKLAQLQEGSSGADTYALIAIARAFKFDARAMGVAGYGSLFYLGIRLSAEHGEAQIQRHSATIYPFTVKWLDPPD